MTKTTALGIFDFFWDLERQGREDIPAWGIAPGLGYKEGLSPEGATRLVLANNLIAPSGLKIHKTAYSWSAAPGWYLCAPLGLRLQKT